MRVLEFHSSQSISYKSNRKTMQYNQLATKKTISKKKMQHTNVVMSLLAILIISAFLTINQINSNSVYKIGNWCKEPFVEDLCFARCNGIVPSFMDEAACGDWYGPCNCEP